MSFSPYFVVILNFISGRPLSETTPPDSTTDDEKILMEQSYTNLGLLSEKEIEAITKQLNTTTKRLYQGYQRSHEKYDILRKNGVALHHLETLWLEALDKALPYMENVMTLEDIDSGKLSLKEIKELTATNEELTNLHTLLTALVQFSVRELHHLT